MSQPAASQSSTMRIQDAESIERRSHRRYDMESQGITVERCGAGPQRRETLGQIVDLSAMGVRVRTKDASVKVDNQIRIRIDLPAYAGIHPFVDTATGEPQPKREWAHSSGKNDHATPDRVEPACRTLLENHPPDHR